MRSHRWFQKQDVDQIFSQILLPVSYSHWRPSTLSGRWICQNDDHHHSPLWKISRHGNISEMENILRRKYLRYGTYLRCGRYLKTKKSQMWEITEHGNISDMGHGKPQQNVLTRWSWCHFSQCLGVLYRCMCRSYTYRSFLDVLYMMSWTWKLLWLRRCIHWWLWSLCSLWWSWWWSS